MLHAPSSHSPFSVPTASQWMTQWMTLTLVLAASSVPTVTCPSMSHETGGLLAWSRHLRLLHMKRKGGSLYHWTALPLWKPVQGTVQHWQRRQVCLNKEQRPQIPGIPPPGIHALVPGIHPPGIHALVRESISGAASRSADPTE